MGKYVKRGINNNMKMIENLEFSIVMIQFVEKVQLNVPDSMMCHRARSLHGLNKGLLELYLVLVVLAVKQPYPHG